MATTKAAAAKKTAAKKTAKKKATPKKTVAKKMGAKKTTKKTAVKKAAAKPAATSAKAVAPFFGEHPEGMFARFAALRDEMDQLFTGLSRGFGFPEFRMPSIELPSRAGVADVRFEVSESDKAVEVTAEVPGLDPEHLDITLTEGVLTVKGEKKDTREEKGKDYHVSERRYGAFTRSFRVPESVAEDRIEATFDKGVLTITLPKHARKARPAKAIKVDKS